jgi:D-alanyl-D-alanine dipeptidase
MRDAVGEGALTRLATGSHAGIWAMPIYRERGYDEALDAIWVRAELEPRLQRAADAALRDGHGLLVWDGWRPAALQETLFEEYKARLEADSGLSGEALEALVARFVTDPRRASSPPAHSTGAALDVTLCDPSTGAARDLGGEFDELTDRSRPGFYDAAPDDAGRRYARLRAELDAAMRAGAFVRLDTEWWHFEFGTDYWAKVTGGPAIFDRVGGPAT